MTRKDDSVVRREGERKRREKDCLRSQIKSHVRKEGTATDDRRAKQKQGKYIPPKKEDHKENKVKKGLRHDKYLDI